VAFHDFPANREAHTGTRMFMAMQSHVWLEDALQIVRLDAGAMIANGKEPLVRLLFDSDFNVWGIATAVLDRIANQVFENFHEPIRVTHDTREGIVFDYGVAFSQVRPELGKHVAQNDIHGRGLKRGGLNLQRQGIPGQAFDEQFEPLRTVDDKVEAFQQGGSRRFAILKDQFDIGTNGAEGGPQIVAGAQEQIAGFLLHGLATLGRVLRLIFGRFLLGRHNQRFNLTQHPADSEVGAPLHAADGAGTACFAYSDPLTSSFASPSAITGML
jgi:hypothetical protein